MFKKNSMLADVFGAWSLFCDSDMGILLESPERSRFASPNLSFFCYNARISIKGASCYER